MENDCLTERTGASAFGKPVSPYWAWIYELRPPPPSETIGRATISPEHRRLLQAAENPEAAFDGSGLFDYLLGCGDIEAACVSVVLGMTSVFEAGSDFREFAPWERRVERLLAEPKLSALGHSALQMQTAIAQLLGPSQIPQIMNTLDEFGNAAELADSDAQRILHASLRGYCELMSGRLTIADAIVRDALYLSPEPSTHPFPKLHLRATLSLINTLRDNQGHRCEYMDAAIASPDFDRLPSSLWLTCMGHRLLSLAVANQATEELEAVADRIRARSIPSQKHYFRSYTHYALGAAALLTGQPEAALFHAETAIDMARRCYSTVAERTASLLAIQALADLGLHQRALDWLATSQDAWRTAGANLLSASGALEEANLELKLGHTVRAHMALAQARAALPIGEALPCNLRRQSWISNLIASLSPAPEQLSPPDPRPVQITTFGELCVEINGKRLYDRDWHGTRTKTLLKALIVLGGYKVSAERLCDMLWPDADGDVARNNLKVALWRLRHLGCKKGETPLPWVVIQHGHVSLVRRLCHVDCIEFETTLKTANSNRDPIRLCTALLCFTDNFLAADDSENWIIQRREALKHAFLSSINYLTEIATPEGSGNSLLHILDTALRLTPGDMQLHRLRNKLNPYRM